MKKHVIELCGWVGVVCVLMAYGLVTFGVFASVSLPYVLLNIVGAGGIIVSSLAKKDFQPVVLNILWLSIALVGLVSLAA
jgi:hypothetical protein